MRKYTGEAPSAIKEIRIVADRYLVKTNNGGQYFIDDQHPIEKRDVMDYKFTRAQPQTFQQQGFNFYRMIDGWALDFVNYAAVEDSTSNVRRMFIEDMARQNIVPRFTA